MSVTALACANGRRQDERLLVGEILRVPKSEAPGASRYLPYKVRPGDTLTAIGTRFGMGLEGLARVNVLDPARILLTGTTLRVRAALRGPPSTHSEVLAAIDRWASAYGLDRSLVRGLAWMESGYREGLVSAAGAVGVMQVLPSTWSFVETVLLGQRVPQAIDGNVHVGVAYLDHLLTLFGGDERLALAAYYQGPASVRIRGVFHKSQDYADDILALRGRM